MVIAAYGAQELGEKGVPELGEKLRVEALREAPVKSLIINKQDGPLDRRLAEMTEEVGRLLGGVEVFDCGLRGR